MEPWGLFVGVLSDENLGVGSRFAVDVLLRDRPPSVYQSLILWLGLRFHSADDVLIRIVFLSALRESVDFLFVASLRALCLLRGEGVQFLPCWP